MADSFSMRSSKMEDEIVPSTSITRRVRLNGACYSVSSWNNLRVRVKEMTGKQLKCITGGYRGLEDLQLAVPRPRIQTVGSSSRCRDGR